MLKILAAVAALALPAAAGHAYWLRHFVSPRRGISWSSRRTG